MKKIISHMIFLLVLFFSILPSVVYSGEKVYFFHNDATGTPVAITDETGKVVWRAEYLPFGQEHEVTGTIENQRRFVGKEKDEETGFYYFGARYMMPEVGRFISPDPVMPVDPWTSKTNYSLLTNPQRLNPYTYGLNNPYRYVDPYGLDVWFVGVGSSFFIGNIGPYAKINQRGYGKQAGLGVAYDTETKKIIIFATGGAAKPEDKVLGINIGVGAFGGKIEGKLEDFLGESQEFTKTFLIVTKTDIITSTGKKGISFSTGKGFGFSYTEITTETFNLIKRLKKKLKLRNNEPLKKRKIDE